MPVLPLPTLFLLGDKTFNYRYLVPLRIPNVLIASPPRTSFHGKIIEKRPRKASNAVQSESEGLRTRLADGINLSTGAGENEK